MSTFRSYFSKNSTLIEQNSTNNSQNPVCEISYGTMNQLVSRFIFDIDFSKLINKISTGIINPNNITKHTLYLTNTISYAPQYLGKKSYSETIDRASGFDLELFNIDEDWNEGSGYDFVYDESLEMNIAQQAPNWYERKSNLNWGNSGVYVSGITQTLGTQSFETGAENIEIDITDYINQRLFGTLSGYTGTTIYSGTSYGIGIKFPDTLESLATESRQAVAFHVKETNTWYEPYIETTIDDTITDDRNYFYLDKDNDLYLYVNVGNGNVDYNITINEVNIYDYNDLLINTISGASVVNVSKGIYKITLNIDSLTYPDAVIFSDEWKMTINGKETTHIGEFYLKSQDQYYTFDQSNQIDFNNYHFYFWGIGEKEYMRAGVVKKIKLSIKELYSNQNNFLPLDIEYRIFTTLGKNYQIDVVPFTKVNRTNSGYEFNLDTSWLIPQDYYLQIRLKNGNYYENKSTLCFTIVSDGVV